MSITLKNRSASRRSTCNRKARAVLEALENRELFSLLGVIPGMPATSVMGPDGSLTYTAATGSFQAAAVPTAMLFPSSISPISAPSSFNLNVTVHPDSSGNIASVTSGSAVNDLSLAGTVSIATTTAAGTVTTTYSGTLLTGTITQMGSQAVDATDSNFDFRFTVTGGLLAPTYFTGQDIGLLLTAENSSFTGSFNNNFTALTKATLGPIDPLVTSQPISISGFKYQDMTGNGLTSDDMSHPIAGVTMQLVNSSNQVIATTVTGANGAYVFNDSDVPGGLSAGTYTVKEVVPAGYIETAPASGSYTVVATSGAYANLDFDNYMTSGCKCMCGCGSTPTLTTATSSLSGTVFADCNNNGKMGSGDSGISGVKITLTGTDLLGDTINLTTTTDRNGNYTFSHLIAGNYTITESQPAGYTDGIDSVGSLGGALGNDVISNITVPPCASGCGYDFAELKTTTISGCTGHANCCVQIKGCDDTGHQFTCDVNTDCHGNFSCANIRGGCYTVTECDSHGHSTGYHNDCNINWSHNSCSYSFGGFSCSSSNSFGCNSQVSWDNCFGGSSNNSHNNCR